MGEEIARAFQNAGGGFAISADAHGMDIPGKVLRFAHGQDSTRFSIAGKSQNPLRNQSEGSVASVSVARRHSLSFPHSARLMLICEH
jgi:hypothetical protein